ncbi:MAG: hypothetical protein EXQ77_06055 [Thermoleophilia bacterium]|nr:hypothetical protein [Thermoleophilia bacterium]
MTIAGLSARTLVDRALLLLGGLCGLLMVGCLSWAVVQAFLRPPDYAEACVLFNASRIRAGFALYVDPLLGAHEYGEPPARYYVAYTPIFSAMVAAFPPPHALAATRFVGLLAWYGALAALVATARPDCRRAAALGALFVGGMFLLTRWSVCAKPDAVALCLAAFALARTIARGRADAVSGAIFVVAALVKPNIFGAGLGAICATVVFTQHGRFSSVIAACAVLLVFVGGMEAWSGGQAHGHLRAATALEFHPGLLAENVASRAPFIGGLVIAALTASRASADARGRIALAALGSSVAIASLGFGKFGSASNYLMEPAIVSVVILARLPLPLRATLRGGAVLVAVVCTFAWAGMATVRSLAHERATLWTVQPALSRIRQRCANTLVVSPDPGIEMIFNGRLYTHSLELWAESERGRFPADLWAADMRDPAVGCVVTWTGDAPVPAVPHGPFPEAVSAVLRERFTLGCVDTGYAVYMAKGEGRSP